MTNIDSVDPIIQAMLRADHLSEETRTGYSKRLALIATAARNKAPEPVLTLHPQKVLIWIFQNYTEVGYDCSCPCSYSELDHWTPTALKKVEQRSLTRVAIEAVLCDQAAQVTKGKHPGTFVYQQLQRNDRSLLRVAVGPLEGPEPRARIRTAYYTTQVSTYWDKDVIAKVCKQHPANGHTLFLFVLRIFSVLLSGARQTRSRLPHHI